MGVQSPSTLASVPTGPLNTLQTLRCSLKPYPPTMAGGSMVEIECPHCDEDIELDDDEFGLFECPYCEEEFLWEQESKSIEIKPAADFSVSDLRYFLPPAVLIGGFIIIGLILLWIVLAFGNAMSCGWQTTC